ncbi:hypothetical protein ACGF0D_03555 [Kitasatospora sp. NPDC048298]|uniref:hypothetical protein n=1 Tax=Kitasatospora sp. NPDC048298 TaxID=3364049 RepID=UPI0037175633
MAASGDGTLLRSRESLGVEVWTVPSLHHVRPELHENASDHRPLIESGCPCPVRRAAERHGVRF